MKLPKEIKNILGKLEKAGFEAYAVGGCVRDLLLGKKPKDWDIATKAKPGQIQEIFPDSFYANKFGTVTVKTESKDNTLKEVEITTFRTEQKYTDKRHPDNISFTDNLEKDLSRRDFTVNALALDKKGRITDLFNGQEDIKKRLIKAVGNADARFGEDALRMLRAVRLMAELSSSNTRPLCHSRESGNPEKENTGFRVGKPAPYCDTGPGMTKNTPGDKWQIKEKTYEAIRKNSGWLQAVAKERIRDELIKIIMSDEPEEAIEILRETGLLKYIIPELEKGVGVSQNRHHIYTIYRHSVLALKFAAKRKYNLEVRLAALLHDIAKPQTKRGEGEDSTFYNHDIVGARFTANILQRLRFPKKTIEKVAHLVRNHMFVYGVGEVTETGVRRLLRRVGRENMGDLLKLRIADRLGSGCPKAVPYKLRHLEYLIEKVSKDPISVKMLKINGNDLMKILGVKPGPRLGLILDALLAEALENPKINTKKKLSEKAKELNKLSDEELKKKNKIVKEKKEEVDLEIKAKHWVK